MKDGVNISGFSSGKWVAAGMFDGLKDGVRVFGRLLGVGVGGKHAYIDASPASERQCSRTIIN